MVVAAPLRRRTRRFLSRGDERARTQRMGSSSSTCAGDSALRAWEREIGGGGSRDRRLVAPAIAAARQTRLNSGPSSTSPPGCKMPHSSAMAAAVILLSPVTMRTVTPAACTCAMDPDTSCDGEEEGE